MRYHALRIISVIFNETSSNYFGVNSMATQTLKSLIKTPLIKLIAALTVVVGGYLFWQQKEEVVEQEPLLSVVEIGDIENTIASSGSLKPSNFVDVGAQVSGILQKLHVDVGDTVTEGQLLAEIDARVQAERVNASRANLEALQAQLEARESALALANLNADRQERLRADEATSQLEYDTAMNNLATAQASLVQLQKQIEQSEASLKTEVTQLEFTRIFAPVSGTVTSITMNEGRTLNAMQQAPTILTISDLDTMTVETDISEADIGKVKTGMPVYFTTLGNGDRRWYGELRQILPTPVIENNVVLYTGKFDIDNSDKSLLPEMTTQVYFVSSSARGVLKVPMGALTFLDAIEGVNSEDSIPMTQANGNNQGFVRAKSEDGQMPQITPEMRERFRAMREANGNGSFLGGMVRGQGFGSSRLTQPGQRSRATVTVVRDDGAREIREVVVGLTSRVSAEVISGLAPGEQVISGIAQTLTLPEPNQNRGFNPRFMRF
jgi:macrolide-specific efflux system membrane fusion protein